MVRASRSHEILLVAVDAVVPQSRKVERVDGAVAIHAVQRYVRPHQWESILLMDLRDGVHQPVLRSVTTHTVVANCLTVEVGMAGNTIAQRSFIKIDRRMALPTADPGVNTLQGESSGPVIEGHITAHRGPAMRIMACRAIDLHPLAVGRLGPSARRRPQEDQQCDDP